MCLAIPGQVVSIADDPLRSATVSFGGITKDVVLALVPEAGIGDYVIVHAGVAISKLDEAAAKQSLAAFEELKAAGEHLSGISSPDSTDVTDSTDPTDSRGAP